MGKSAKKAVKSPHKHINILEDDQFSVEEEAQQKTPRVPIKNVLGDILKTQVQDPSKTVLSQFTKPILKIKEEAKRIKKQVAEKAVTSALKKSDKSFKYLNNQKLQKNLKLATMKGVIKIMNIISTYRKDNPDEVK